MLKQLSILFVISIILIIFAEQTQIALSYLHVAYNFLNAKLSYIFNTNPIGNTAQEVFCLMLIPLSITAVPAFAYYLVKRKSMPYFFHTLWGIWIVLFTSLALTQ